MARPKRCAGAARGFTLLELLVVFALLALMVGVALPRMSGWQQAAERRAQLDSLRVALEALPRQAFFSGEARVLAWAPDGQLEDAGAVRLPLPAGWRLTSSVARLSYDTQGMSSGAVLTVLTADGLRVEWEVLAPSGRILLREPRP